MTVRRTLFATAPAVASLGVAAPAANACAGVVRATACTVLGSEPVQQVADIPCPR